MEIGYDAALRITSERYHTAAGVLEEELGYTYDADGNRLTKTRNGVVSTYSYAAGSRLVGVSTEGELEARVTDNGGRETSLVVDGRQLSLTYDSDDHVTRVVDGSATTEFAFDALGRRTRAIDAHGEKRYLIAPIMGDGREQPHAITDAGGGILATFAYAGDVPLYRYANGVVEYYLADEDTTVIGKVGPTGVAPQLVDYDGFGVIRNGQVGSSAHGGDFGFQGMWRNEDGLYYVKARVYEPETGRFTSRDPARGFVEEPETLTPYAFANSNPFVWSDPLGRFAMVQVSFSVAIQQSLAAASLVSFVAYLGKARGDAFKGQVHRVGRNTPDNFVLSERDKTGDPPGLSVILGGTPQQAAQEMRLGFPKHKKMLEKSKYVSSTRLAFIYALGFSVMPTPSNNLPNHGTLYNPTRGVDGFTEESSYLLSLIFTETYVP